MKTRVKFSTRFGATLLQALQERGWERVEGTEDYDFTWLTKEEIPVVYEGQARKLSGTRPFFVNHFQNSQCICRKDLLASNVQKAVVALKAFPKCQGLFKVLIPQTFLLPFQMGMFEINADQAMTFIVKPATLLQGQGIFIDNYQNIVKWFRTKYQQIIQDAGKHDEKAKASLQRKYEEMNQFVDPNRLDSFVSGHEIYLIQAYITNPLLINRHKFDCRVYVLVTSFQPTLQVYICREGFARFALTTYKPDFEDRSSHLTNVAIQKNSENYDNAIDGAKWSLTELFEHIAMTHGADNAIRSQLQTEKTVIRVLQTVIAANPPCKAAFEIYGFDILYNAELQPLVCEVNMCPSLAADTAQDSITKRRMLHDAFSILNTDSNVAQGRNVFGCWHKIFDSPSPILEKSILLSDDQLYDQLNAGYIETPGFRFGGPVDRMLGMLYKM